jgi:hypothetical protein
VIRLLLRTLLIFALVLGALALTDLARTPRPLAASQDIAR